MSERDERARAKIDEAAQWGVALAACAVDLARIAEELQRCDQKRNAAELTVLASRTRTMARELMSL